MKNALLLEAAVMLLSFQFISAKTPAQLKSEFAGIMPGGMKARMAWAQGSASGYGSNNAQIYGIDSDDGEVRQITTGTLNADWPCISGDGSRVFFYDYRTGDVKIINWTGGTMRTLQADYYHASGDFCMESWVDPNDKSDWVVIGGPGFPVGRIKVDSPNQIVNLWPHKGYPSPSGGDGIGLSIDGTHLGAMWDKGGSFTSGVGNIATGAVKQHATWIGCGVSMPPDNSYKVSFADGEIRLSTGELPYTAIPANSEIIDSVESARKEIQNCSQDYLEMASQRWTSHPGYLATCYYRSAMNPFLYRVSDHAFICIRDDASCAFFGHADVCFIASSALTSPPHALRSRTAGITTPRAAYRIDGRRLSPSLQNSAEAQVAFRNAASGAQGLRAVLLVR